MPRVNDDAADLMAAGYWSPYAETSIPTGTQAGSYYLLCNLPSSMKLTGQIVGQGGEPEAPTPDEHSGVLRRGCVGTSVGPRGTRLASAPPGPVG